MGTLQLLPTTIAYNRAPNWNQANLKMQARATNVEKQGMNPLKLRAEQGWGVWKFKSGSIFFLRLSIFRDQF